MGFGTTMHHSILYHKSQHPLAHARSPEPIILVESRDEVFPRQGDSYCTIQEIARRQSAEPQMRLPRNWTKASSSVPDSQKTEAMKLLEAHGITLLPEDAGSSSNMIHSGGRATLALSEAGKMVLSSSSASSSAQQHNKGTTIVKSVTARKLAAPSGSVQVVVWLYVLVLLLELGITQKLNSRLTTKIIRIVD